MSGRRHDEMSTSVATRRRVLVIVQGDLGDRPLGPEIRGLEMARALAARHDVTISASAKKPFVHAGFRVVPRSRRSLWRELRRHDVVVGPVLPPHLLSLAANKSLIRVADLYDPVDIEWATIEGNDRVVQQQLRLRRLQLRWADVIVSANDRQHDRAVADLAGARRRRSAPALITVPMGLPEVAGATSERPLRDRLGLGAADPVVLWWGTPWRWLDADTAVRAVAELARRRPDVRLVITAGQPRNRGSDPINRTDAARELARSLGLLDRNVFFFGDWVAFEDRHRYLRDADLAITLSAAGPEAVLAARSRYMDYLWAGVASVLTEGDQLAAEMARCGAARLVSPHDAAGVADTIDRFLGDPVALSRAREACGELAARYRWSAVVEPLLEAIDGLQLTRGSARELVDVLTESGSYYIHQALEAIEGISRHGRSKFQPAAASLALTRRRQ